MTFCEAVRDGLLHPVLYVAEPQHEVDRGDEEDDEERDEKGEEED